MRWTFARSAKSSWDSSSLSRSRRMACPSVRRENLVVFGTPRFYYPEDDQSTDDPLQMPERSVAWWEDVSRHAESMFRVWTDGRELDWAKKSWDALGKRGLTSYSNQIEWTCVMVRLWTNGLGEEILSLVYWLESVSHEDLVLHLVERVWPDGRKTSFREAIPLTKTRPNFGGQRWWFICPLTVNGVACGRRVRKLYLPPGGQYFGCRNCYDLTYESAQEHDSRVDALLKNPDALLAAVESKDFSEAFLAMKALVKVIR